MEHEPASELRERRPASTPATPERAGAPSSEEAKDNVQRQVEALATAVPAAAQPYVVMAAPYVAMAYDAGAKALPYAEAAVAKGTEVWEAMQPYKPHLLLPAILGLIMAFFGGTFLLTIACVEAYRMTGWESSWRCIKQLYTQLQRVHRVSSEDDERDDDGDGIPDVKQIDAKALAQRKMHLFLTTVDPAVLTDAIAGLNAGFLAVLAVLRVQFARTLALGAAIGNVLEPIAQRILGPILGAVIPADYRKWIAPAIKYLCAWLGMSVAWFLERIISGFHSAVRGGFMFARCMLAYLAVQQIIPAIDHEDTYIDEIVGAIIAAVGFGFQFSMGFTLPWFLKLPFLPFTIVEYMLQGALMPK